MQVRLTDQGVVAVALARAAAGPAPPTVAHLLLGLTMESEGRAGARLRARASAAATLSERAPTAPAPRLDVALAAAGYQRDLDGWLRSDPAEEWFEHPETYGFQPGGDEIFDAAAASVVAQVRAVNGGAIEVLLAAAAAPDAGLAVGDPSALASTAVRLRRSGGRWDAGLDTVVEAAQTLAEGDVATIRDLVRATLVAGGDGPKLVLELAGSSPGTENPPFS